MSEQALSLRQFTGLKLLQWTGLYKQLQQLTSINSRGSLWPLIRESFTGAWQLNVEIELANVLSHPTVFACITLIASDISKMCLRLVEMDKDGIWTPVESPAFSPVLRAPNHYQITTEFIRTWVISVLTHGNTYVLLGRDQRRVVDAMYVLDPTRVKVLLAPNGDVYYQLMRDDLSQQPDDGIVVQASEMIHHKINTLNHPLAGLSPIYACGLAAVLGLRMQTNSAHLFANGSSPGGLLKVPTAINQEQADRLKAKFVASTTGANSGGLAVLTSGLEYQPIAQTAVEAELVDQWKATAEAVCSTFHVPAYMVGVGPPPSYANIQPLLMQYFAQALQEPSKCIEDLIDKALGLHVKIDGRQLGVEFDKDDLLWMDTATMVEVETKKVGGAITTTNEARKRFNLKPVEGGDDVLSQQQNWSLAALSRRDEMALVPAATPTTLPQGTIPEEPEPDEADEKDVMALLRKELGLAA